MTLEEARVVEAVARPVARSLIAFVLGSLVATRVALNFADAGAVRVALTWGAPLLLICLMMLGRRLRGTSPMRVDPMLLGAGIAALAVTAGFDVIITVMKDPGLAMEGNPYARMLLDSGKPASFVMAYGVTCQVLLVAGLVTLYSAVLAHAEPLRVLAWGMGPRDRKQFIAAATRGTTDSSAWHGLRLRDWTSMKAHPVAIWLASTLCIGSCLGRTGLALEWLGVRLPPALGLIVVVMLTLGTISAAWSRVWRRGMPQGMTAEASTEVLPTAGTPPRRGDVALWIGTALLGLGLFASREFLKARSVQAELDERLDRLRAEVAEAADAARHADETAAELVQLQAEWDQAPAARAMPCVLDDAELLAAVRAIVEPMGGVVGDDAVQRPRHKDYYAELPVLVDLPHRPGALNELRTALSTAPRLLVLAGPPDGPATRRYIVAFEYDCADQAPPLERYDEAPWGRDALRWPFDRGVARQEDEISRLRDERDRNAAALETLRRKRSLSAGIARRQTIAERLERDAAEARR